MLTGSLVVIYLAIMVAIGIWGMRKTATLNDFFLGGRQIGPFVSALSYGTTYFSAVLFIGFAGKIGWGFGLDSLWIAVGNAFLGSMLAWLVLGHRTRVMSHNLGSMTMPEFFESRYGCRALRIVSALIIFVFLLPYSASVYKGLAHLFEINFHMPYLTAVIVMAAITGIYLVLGGYFAVTLTDFIQGIIMFFGAIAMVWQLLAQGGGVSEALCGIQNNYGVHVPVARQPGWLALASLVFMTSFGTWGLPQMVQKFYAIRNERVIWTAAWVTTVFALVIVTCAYLSGATSHLFFEPAQLPKLPDGKPNFDLVMPELLKAKLSPLLMAVILLLVLAASMSTLSSLVLVSSSAIAIDIYAKHRESQVHHDRTLVLMRVLSGVFVILSVVLALYPFDLIVTLMSLSWGAVAGSFMAIYVYGLYWKGTSLAGVWTGMLTGLTLAIVLFFKMGPAQSPLASSIAMVVPFLVVPAVSGMTRRPDPERIRKAFEGIQPE
jgi:SSS family solute:Na+ symporter